MTHTIDYTPPPTGERFMRSNARVRFLKGPVGSGKSTTCVVEVFRRCAEMPKSQDGFRRSRWAIVRNTLPQLKTTTYKTWEQWFPPGKAGHWREGEKTFHLQIGDIKAEILFLPLDTPDDTQRLLSLELTGVFINEAREVPPEIITAALSRVGRYPSRAQCKEPYWYGLIMDSNPPSRDSWLFEQFEERKPDGWEAFHQPGGMEPDAENRENLPETYYEDMMDGASEDWVDVHVHGKYGRSVLGRPVYERTFKRDFHVSPSILVPINSPTVPLLIGQDFGRTPAAVLGQQDYTGRVRVLDAIVTENMSLDTFIKRELQPLLARKFPHCKPLIVGDPSGFFKGDMREETARDVFRAAGFESRPAPTNDIDPRLRAVDNLLTQQVEGKAMMLFSHDSTSPGMKHLIAGLDGGYKYKRKKDGSFEMTPQKDGYSHDNDALQYFALGLGYVGGAWGATSQRREVKHVSALGWT